MYYAQNVTSILAVSMAPVHEKNQNSYHVVGLFLIVYFWVHLSHGVQLNYWNLCWSLLDKWQEVYEPRGDLYKK